MAKKLQALREAKGLTQSELAEKAGIHRVTIARYETGRIAPSFENAVKLADALGVSTEDLRDDALPDD